MQTSYKVFMYKVQSDDQTIINYSYVIVDKQTNEAAIIDPAWNIEVFLDLFEKSNIKPKFILLTHSHEDHVNLVTPLTELFDLNVYMSKTEIEHYNYTSKNLIAIEKDYQCINLGVTQIKCLNTPGHTAGSLSFLLSDSLFTGDTLFIEGCGLCAEGGSPYELFHSIQKIKKHVSSDMKVFPGHSYGATPGCTFEYVLKNNLYCLIEDIESFVAFRTRKNQINLFEFK